MRLQRASFNNQKYRDIAFFADRLLRVSKYVNFNKKIKQNIYNQAISNSVKALTANIFLNLRRCFFSADFFYSTAIFIFKNNIVEFINTLLLISIPSTKQILYLANFYKNSNTAALFSIKFLHTITILALPLYQLCLKIGCPVILLRNLNLDNGFCNSTHLLVESVFFKLLRCFIFRTRRYSSVVQLFRIPLPAPELDTSVTFTRLQFPVKLAFIIIINKAQR